MWNRLVEERYSHGVLDGQLAAGICQEAPIGVGSHRTQPGFARRVNEATVYPTRYTVQLTNKNISDRHQISQGMWVVI